MATIRRLQPDDDLGDLVALSREFFAEYEGHHPFFFDIDELRDEDITGYFSRLIHKDDGAVFVALSDGRAVGYITAYVRENAPFYRVKRFGEISGLMVDRAFRRQGIGEALLAAATTFFCAEGVRCYTVYTSAANAAAIGLYEQHGMERLYVTLLGDSGAEPDVAGRLDRSEVTVEPRTLLAELAGDLGRLLGSNLVGIYLHGSLAMGCFNPDSSDVDLLIVLRKDITKVDKRALIALLMDHEQRLPGKGIEMSAMLRQALDEWRFPPPYVLHYSSAHTQRYLDDPTYICEGTGDPDLGAHLTVVYHRGLCLWGEPIAQVFHPIPVRDYLAAVRYDLEGMEQAILREPVYNVLNLCRTLRYLREGEVGSKAEGGAWAVEHVPQQHRDLVVPALACYTSSVPARFAPDELTAFARYMLREIDKAEATTSDGAAQLPG